MFFREKFIAFFLTCFFALSVCFTAGADDIVKLRTHLHPPYQLLDDKELTGTGVQAVRCVFTQMGRKYQISLSPPNRNRYMLESGKIEGLFLSIPNSELSQSGIATEPLGIERWKFFRLAGPLNISRKPVPDLDDRIGSVLGSNEGIWLTRRRFEKMAFSSDMKSLIKVLLNKRIDYALADEAAFLQAAKEYDLSLDNVGSSFVRYVPLVAYFSRDFLAQNTGFMDQFNNKIDLCPAGAKQPTEPEKQRLAELAKLFVSQRDLQRAITEQIAENRADKSQDDNKRQQDARWIEARKNKSQTETLFMKFILGNDLSKKLNNLKQNSNGKISEVFVFDNRGYILGLSQITSDYWQGDEEKYSRVFEDNEPMNFSRIQFDSSTRKFQVSVTMPVFDPDTGEKVAGITFGFDADISLSDYAAMKPL